MLKKDFKVVGIAALFLGILMLAPMAVSAQPFSGIEFTSAQGIAGSTARVPLILAGVTEPIGVMNLTLTYDPSLLSVEEVVKGELLSNATFKVATDPGIIELAISDPGGFSRDGVVAVVRFNILASSGYSPLRIIHLSAKAAATRSTLYLQRKEGTLTIIPGLSFSTSSAGQRIAVDTSSSGTAVTINGPRIVFVRDNITFTVTTEGLGGTAPRFTGLVKEVSGTPLPINGTFSGGEIREAISVTTPSYMSEGSVNITLEGTVSPGIENQFRSAGERARLNISTVLFIATTTLEGFSTTTTATASFTLPTSALPSSSNQSLYVGYLKNDGTVEFSHPDLQQHPNQETFTFSVPLKQGSPSLGVVLAQEIERPPVTTVPRTTDGTIFSEGGEAAAGSLWTGMFLIFFLVAVVVVSVFYVHRKRGG
ncbi:MAG: hypothetical protein LUO82_05665 [Methanomicrobiales archaeon]|nr:hypothetical protein [Methanomicrobiales archaeon]